jgi:hypothetical protein
LRFHIIFKLSIGIQKSIDSDGFYCGMDFERLFSSKYT